MATFRGLAPELLEPWVTEIFFKEFTEQARFSTELFNQKTATGAFVDDFQVAGLGTFQLKPEGYPAVTSYRTRVTQTVVKEDGRWVAKVSHWSPWTASACDIMPDRRSGISIIRPRI